MREFLIELIGISLPVSAIILLLLAFSRGIKSTFTASCRYVIWLVVIIRLAIPFGGIFLPSIIEIPVYETEFTENGEKLPQKDETHHFVPHSGAVDVPGPIISDKEPSAEDVTDEADRSNEKAFTLSPSMIVPALFILWGAGACAFILTDIVRYNVFCIKAKGSLVVAEGEELSVYEKLCTEMKIANPPILYKSSLFESPVLYGYFRRTVVIPDMELSENALRSVLSHELTHHRRGDLWTKLLARFANALHWFNPFVYLAVSRFNREMELSCDEKVIAALSEEERVLYGKTMLDIVQSCRGREASLTTKFNPKKKAASERIENILDTKKKKHGIIIICAVVALCLLIGVVIGFKVIGSSSNKDGTPDNKAEETTGVPDSGGSDDTADSPTQTTAPDDSTAPDDTTGQNETTGADETTGANAVITDGETTADKGTAYPETTNKKDETKKPDTQRADTTTAQKDTTKAPVTSGTEKESTETNVPVNEEEQLALAHKYLMEGKHTQAYNALWLIRDNEIAARILEDFVAIPTKCKRTENGKSSNINIVTLPGDRSVTVNLPDHVYTAGNPYIPYTVAYNIGCYDKDVCISSIDSYDEISTKIFTFDDDSNVIRFEHGYSIDTYEYNKNGNVIKEVVGVANNYTTYTYEYDDNGNLIKLTRKSNAVNDTFEYTYSKTGKMLTKTRNGSLIEKREYDSYDRIIAEIYSSGDRYNYTYGKDCYYRTYGSVVNKYDMNGNILEENLSGTLLSTYTYNSRGQLTSMNRHDAGTPWSLCKYVKMEYDGNGRLKRAEKMTNDGEVIVTEYSDYGMYYVPDDDTAYYIRKSLELNYR